MMGHIGTPRPPLVFCLLLAFCLLLVLSLFFSFLPSFSFLSSFSTQSSFISLPFFSSQYYFINIAIKSTSASVSKFTYTVVTASTIDILVQDTLHLYYCEFVILGTISSDCPSIGCDITTVTVLTRLADLPGVYWSLNKFAQELARDRQPAHPEPAISSTGKTTGMKTMKRTYIAFSITIRVYFR